MPFLIPAYRYCRDSASLSQRRNGDLVLHNGHHRTPAGSFNGSDFSLVGTTCSMAVDGIYGDDFSNCGDHDLREGIS